MRNKLPLFGGALLAGVLAVAGCSNSSSNPDSSARGDSASSGPVVELTEADVKDCPGTNGGDGWSGGPWHVDDQVDVSAISESYYLTSTVQQAGSGMLKTWKDDTLWTEGYDNDRVSAGDTATVYFCAGTVANNNSGPGWQKSGISSSACVGPCAPFVIKTQINSGQFAQVVAVPEQGSAQPDVSYVINFASSWQGLEGSPPYLASDDEVFDGFGFNYIGVFAWAVPTATVKAESGVILNIRDIPSYPVGQQTYYGASSTGSAAWESQMVDDGCAGVLGESPNIRDTCTTAVGTTQLDANGNKTIQLNCVSGCYEQLGLTPPPGMPE